MRKTVFVMQRGLNLLITLVSNPGFKVYIIYDITNTIPHLNNPK